MPLGEHFFWLISHVEATIPATPAVGAGADRMLDLSKLPQALVYVIDTIVTPIIMVWFLVRWLRLAPDDGKHRTAVNATRRGGAAGIALAALVVFLVQYYWPPMPAPSSKLSLLSLWSAVIAGALAGLLPRLAPKLHDDNDESGLRAWTRGLVTAAATTIALAGLVLYYSYYSRDYLLHLWLMFAFMTLLCMYRLSYVVGE